MIKFFNTLVYSFVFLVGFFSIFPNIMMSDDGTKMTQIASTIGLSASLILIFSGITGLLDYNLSYYLCILGLILQFISFLIISNKKIINKLIKKLQIFNK
jgi:hypothetical protein